MGKQLYLNPVAITAGSDHTLRDLGGFNLQETAGSSADVNLRVVDGSGTATGTIIAQISLAANESSLVVFGEGNVIPCRNEGQDAEGVHVEAVSGAVDGVLYEAL